MDQKVKICFFVEYNTVGIVNYGLHSKTGLQNGTFLFKAIFLSTSLNVNAVQNSNISVQIKI